MTDQERLRELGEADAEKKQIRVLERKLICLRGPRGWMAMTCADQVTLSPPSLTV